MVKVPGRALPWPVSCSDGQKCHLKKTILLPRKRRSVPGELDYIQSVHVWPIWLQPQVLPHPANGDVAPLLTDADVQMELPF